MFNAKGSPRLRSSHLRSSIGLGTGAALARLGSRTSFPALARLGSRPSFPALVALGSLAACAPSPAASDHSPEVAETLENLVAAGFPESELRVRDGVVYAGGDASVSLAASREMIASPSGTTHEQYRSANVVSEAVTEICLEGSLLPGLLSTALDDAIGNYNALGLRKRLRRVIGDTSSCQAAIFVARVPGFVALSAYPSGGLPGASIQLGEELPVFGRDVVEHIITHEIGHTLGLRHSDFYDRSISCGGLAVNEGDAGLGVVQIAGTPALAVDGGSVMNACYHGSENGEFTRSDVVAVNALYGFAQAFYGTQWSGSYSDAAGWAASDSHWGTIDFPDVSGDGKADVCGRGVSGIACGRSNGAAFESPTQWTADFSNAASWNVSESYWGTVRFPDVSGDGKADLCGRSASGIQCALSNGTSFGALSLWTAGYSDAGGWGAARFYWGTIQYPDLNGDGRADVCGRGGPGLLCALSTGAGFGPVTLWSAGYSDAGGWAGLEAYWGTIRFADLNGDGRDDVCGRSGPGLACALSNGSTFSAVTTWSTGYSDAAGWAGSESMWRTVRFPDVNGDGGADVCGRSATGIVCALSNGTSFGPVTAWTSGFGDADGWADAPSYFRTIEFPDLQGDGRADVCGRNAKGIFCASSFGASFGLVAGVTRSFGDEAGWLTAPSLWRTVRFPDVDGDGAAEVCSRAPDGVTCAR